MDFSQGTAVVAHCTTGGGTLGGPLAACGISLAAGSYRVHVVEPWTGPIGVLNVSGADTTALTVQVGEAKSAVFTVAPTEIAVSLQGPGTPTATSTDHVNTLGNGATVEFLQGSTTVLASCTTSHGTNGGAKASCRVAVAPGTYRVAILGSWTTPTGPPAYVTGESTKTVTVTFGQTQAVTFTATLAAGITVVLRGPSATFATPVGHFNTLGNGATVDFSLGTTLVAQCVTAGGILDGTEAECGVWLVPGSYNVHVAEPWPTLTGAPLYVVGTDTAAVTGAPGQVNVVTFTVALTGLTDIASGTATAVTPTGVLGAYGLGGTGTVTVGRYASDPEGAPSFKAAGQYFDVSVGPDETFTSLEIIACGLIHGVKLQWWDPDADSGHGAWDPVTPTSALTWASTTCLTATITTSTSPDLGELTGTVFGTSFAAPATPAKPAATPGNASVVVGWTAPTDGGSTITSYTVTSSPTSKTCVWSSGPLRCTVTGLTNGRAYTFTVKATNAKGTSPASTPSAAVTPATVSAKPGTPTATAGNASAAVTWAAPATDGGSAVTGYTVTSSPTQRTCSTSALTCSVTGLHNGTAYTFSVTATNGKGASPSSTPSSAVTPFATAYDLVGSDGGVFVFDGPGQEGGYHGSLPGLGVTPAAPIVGMVPTVSDQGYFLVGSDGGVFAFTAPFLGSLPGLGVTPAAPVTGIVACDTDRGYFLVGSDGGVYAFGSVPFLGSLPSKGVAVDDIVGIAATPSGDGYWLVSRTGTVYAFGTAQKFTTATGLGAPVTAIAGTPTGGGYWVVAANGAVRAFGIAKSFGTLPQLGVAPALPVIGIVHTTGTTGYWLLGADGGIFAFGTAPFYGSLPGLKVHVTDVVAAVPN